MIGSLCPLRAHRLTIPTKDSYDEAATEVKTEASVCGVRKYTTIGIGEGGRNILIGLQRMLTTYIIAQLIHSRKRKHGVLCRK